MTSHKNQGSSNPYTHNIFILKVPFLDPNVHLKVCHDFCMTPRSEKELATWHMRRKYVLKSGYMCRKSVREKENVFCEWPFCSVEQNDSIFIIILLIKWAFHHTIFKPCISIVTHFLWTTPQYERHTPDFLL